MQCWLTLLCLVQCLIISYRSFSTTLYSVSVIVVCVIILITTVLYNFIVSVHNSLWDFGNKINVVLEIILNVMVPELDLEL